jgi:hypothetical protein
LDRLNGNQRLVASLVDFLREKGITLSAEELLDVGEAMRKEILHRHVIARRRINNLKRLNEFKEKIVDQTFLKLGRRAFNSVLSKGSMGGG